MKIVTVIDCKIQEGRWAEFRDAATELTEFCNKKWPESTFSLLQPRGGYGSHLLLVLEHPSLAAQEQWEEQDKGPEYIELMSKAVQCQIMGETTVSHFRRLA